MYSDPEVLFYDLPEDILRAKLAGDFARMETLLNARLSSPRVSPMMKERLEFEKFRLSRLLKRYPYDRAGAMERMRARVPDFTEEELDKMEEDGCVDYIYCLGGKRYVSSFSGTLIKMSDDLARREVKAPQEDDGVDLDAFIREIKKTGSAAYRFGIRSSLTIEKEAFEPGSTYTVHIPVPAACAQQPEGEIRILPEGEAVVSDPHAFQRTVCFKRQSALNRPFEAEFTYTSRLKYVDPFRDEKHIVYPGALPPCEDDLCEQLPHICFTPYIRRLAEYIAGDEKRPLYLAKRVYDYVTMNVRYSFMRSYLLIDRQAEYAALNLKGDCGIQAVLFITLCRVLGIPARWQSGLTVDKFSTGDHDWAQFFTEEFGWLFADPSFGGSAFRQGKAEKHAYYFGNLDCFRMVANRRYFSEFDPPKRFIRFDPCDSQDGEAETDARGLDSFEFDKTDKTFMFEKL